MVMAILEMDELLSEAIISETPLIIVEGIDDVPVYESLFYGNGANAEVYAAENIVEGSDGSRGVIDCIDSARAQFPEIDISQYILGIVDRDARYYRGEIPNDQALLVLKAYSLESHFVTKEATRHIIRNMTRVSEKHITPEFENMVFNKVKDCLLDLFYISLEALKNACCEEYESKFGYKQNLQQIRAQNLNNFTEEHIRQLDKFAQSKGITNSWEDLLYICKGKWLMFEFCNILKVEIKLLTEKCREKHIQQCQFCISEAFDKCLYKVKADLNEYLIHQSVVSENKNGSLSYLY
ncbi:hypothetical protein AB4544_17105, partial [Vibrio sp. 10N.222.45.F7]